jgi:hypothetical protein
MLLHPVLGIKNSNLKLESLCGGLITRCHRIFLRMVTLFDTDVGQTRITP